MAVTREELKRVRQALKRSYLIGAAVGILTILIIQDPIFRWVLSLPAFIFTSLFAYFVQAIALRLPAVHSDSPHQNYVIDDTNSSCPEGSTIESSYDSSSFANNNIYSDPGYSGLSGNTFTSHDDFSRRY